MELLIFLALLALSAFGAGYMLGSIHSEKRTTKIYEADLVARNNS